MNYTGRLQRTFCFSAGVLFVLTGLAKCVTAVGGSASLHEAEPVSGVTYQVIFWIVGLTEVGLGCILLQRYASIMSIGLVACFSTWLALYRTSLFFLDYHAPCVCLGSMTALLGIPTDTADLFMQATVGYLLVGSYGLCFWQLHAFRRNRRSLRAMK